jgi:hypothetical protein
MLNLSSSCANTIESEYTISDRRTGGAGTNGNGNVGSKQPLKAQEGTKLRRIFSNKGFKSRVGMTGCESSSKCEEGDPVDMMLAYKRFERVGTESNTL